MNYKVGEEILLYKGRSEEASCNMEHSPEAANIPDRGDRNTLVWGKRILAPR